MNMIGICGDKCNCCPRYIATQDGSIQDLEKVKELWVRLGLRDSNFLAQDMACEGCLPENKCAYIDLRSCPNLKSCENCGLCIEYPCKLIKRAFESEKLEIQAQKVCTQEEMEILRKAFFSKKEYFDHIHQKFQEKSRKE